MQRTTVEIFNSWKIYLTGLPFIRKSRILFSQHFSKALRAFAI